MTGLQADFGRERRPKLFALPRVTVLCIVLLALLTVVQVAHVHPFDSDADHCPLCIAMHTAAPVAVIATVVVLIPIETTASVFEPRAVVRHWHPKLYTRPPPAGC